MESLFLCTDIFFIFFPFVLSVFFVQSAIEIVALTASAAVCGYAFGRINQVAGLLFIPYVGWLAFATYLNVSIYKQNSDQKAITDKKAATIKSD